MQLVKGLFQVVCHACCLLKPPPEMLRICVIKGLALVVHPVSCSHLKPALTVLRVSALTVLCESAPAVLWRSAPAVLCESALAVLCESAPIVLCASARADAGGAVVAAVGAWQCLLLAHCQAQQGAALLSAPAPSMTVRIEMCKCKSPGVASACK